MYSKIPKSEMFLLDLRKYTWMNKWMVHSTLYTVEIHYAEIINFFLIQSHMFSELEHPQTHPAAVCALQFYFPFSHFHLTIQNKIVDTLVDDSAWFLACHRPKPVHTTHIRYMTKFAHIHTHIQTQTSEGVMLWCENFCRNSWIQISSCSSRSLSHINYINFQYSKLLAN